MAFFKVSADNNLTDALFPLPVKNMRLVQKSVYCTKRGIASHCSGHNFSVHYDKLSVVFISAHSRHGEDPPKSYLQEI